MATVPKLTVRFFRTQLGNEPVREWLKSMPAAERKAIGQEIRTVQFGWPLGMPLSASSTWTCGRSGWDSRTE